MPPSGSSAPWYNSVMRNIAFIVSAFFAFCLTMVTAAEAPAVRTSVFGYWTTIDDATGEKKSIVRVYEHDGKVYGRVVKVLTNPQAKAKIKGEPLIQGLDILKDLQKDGEKYTGGKVLDPKSGKVYTAQLWLEEGNLIMRGSFFGIGRKQKWLPAEAPAENPLAPVPDPKF